MVFPAAVAIGTFGLNQAAKNREQARDRANAENEYRKDLLLRLTRAYNDTKKIRRILKAHIVTKRDGSNEKEISCTVYEKQLEKFMDPQLEVELYKPRKGDANVLLLPFENAEGIAQRLGEVEKYRNRVIHEYDGGHYQRQKQVLGIDKSYRIPMNELPRLADFIHTAKFLREYRNKFRSAIQEIQKEIIQKEIRPKGKSDGHTETRPSQRSRP